MWIVTVLAIAGVVLNNYRRRECFVIWMFTNAAWCWYDWSIGAREQAVLFAVYFFLAIWGFREWKYKPGASNGTHVQGR